MWEAPGALEQTERVVIRGLKRRKRRAPARDLQVASTGEAGRRKRNSKAVGGREVKRDAFRKFNGKLSRRDIPIIARRFNAGIGVD